MKLPFTLAIIALAACGGSDPADGGVDLEGCEHLIEGPSTSIDASATAVDAPAISDDHNRYDINLVDDGGQNVGSVSFAAAETGDFVVFLGQDVPLSITDSDGAAVAIEDSATSSPECAEIRGRHVVELEVGTYILSFGPTAESVVQVVIEHDAGEHDDE